MYVRSLFNHCTMKLFCHEWILLCLKVMEYFLKFHDLGFMPPFFLYHNHISDILLSQRNCIWSWSVIASTLQQYVVLETVEFFFHKKITGIFSISLLCPADFITGTYFTWYWHFISLLQSESLTTHFSWVSDSQVNGTFMTSV